MLILGMALLPAFLGETPMPDLEITLLPAFLTGTPMPDLGMPALGMTLLPAFLVWTPMLVLGMTLLPAFLVSLDPRQLWPSTLSRWTFLSVESLDPSGLRFALDVLLF
jgi:hypothetical protein